MQVLTSMDEVCGGHSEGEEECGLNRVMGCTRLARLGVKCLCSTLVLLETGVATGSWFVLHLIDFQVLFLLVVLVQGIFVE